MQPSGTSEGLGIHVGVAAPASTTQAVPPRGSFCLIGAPSASPPPATPGLLQPRDEDSGLGFQERGGLELLPWDSPAVSAAPACATKRRQSATAEPTSLSVRGQAAKRQRARPDAPGPKRAQGVDLRGVPFDLNLPPAPEEEACVPTVSLLSLAFPHTNTPECAPGTPLVDKAPTPVLPEADPLVHLPARGGVLAPSSSPECMAPGTLVASVPGAAEGSVSALLESDEVRRLVRLAAEKEMQRATGEARVNPGARRAGAWGHIEGVSGAGPGEGNSTPYTTGTTSGGVPVPASTLNEALAVLERHLELTSHTHCQKRRAALAQHYTRQFFDFLVHYVGLEGGACTWSTLAAQRPLAASTSASPVPQLSLQGLVPLLPQERQVPLQKRPTPASEPPAIASKVPPSRSWSVTMSEHGPVPTLAAIPASEQLADAMRRRGLHHTPVPRSGWSRLLVAEICGPEVSAMVHTENRRERCVA